MPRLIRKHNNKPKKRRTRLLYHNNKPKKRRTRLLYVALPLGALNVLLSIKLLHSRQLHFSSAINELPFEDYLDYLFLSYVLPDQGNITATPTTKPPTRDELLCAPDGPEGRGGYELLTQQLTISKPPHYNNNNNNNNPSSSSPRIFCALYTYPGGINQTTAIRDTWGGRCDGYMAASTYTDPATGTLNLAHAGPPGQYSSIWPKVRAMILHLHQHRADDYDYFHISGDDTYLVVDNLRAFLANVTTTTNETTPLYMGGPIRPFWKKDAPDGFYYNGGGPGYTLNRAALDVFAKHANHSGCFPDLIESAEDYYLGRCFWELGIRSTPTTIDVHGKPRYLHYDPRYLADPNNYNQQLHKFYRKQHDWLTREFHVTASQHGLDAISETSIAFHLIKTPDYMRRIHGWLYPEYREKMCMEAS